MTSDHDGYGTQKVGAHSEEEEKPQTAEAATKERLKTLTRYQRAIYCDVGKGGYFEDRTPEDVQAEYSLCSSCLHQSTCRVATAGEGLLLVVDRCMEYSPEELEQRE